jgi:septal ring factor EnvC (AmiA/AmiB activator)
MLLESVLPSISRRAEALTADLERLRRIGEELEKDRVTALAARTELDEKRKTMAVLLKDREKLYSAAENGRAEAAEEVQRLAAEAKSLRDLLNKLEKEQEKQSAAHKGPRRRAPTPDAQLPGLGKAQIPAEGIITVSYGEKDGIGAKSEGLTIEASANAIVVSPMGGVVRFSGPFKNYGNMIIIEHKDDYHSLIAGLDDVDVSEGDKLQAGEPVGSLPASSSRGGKPALYYELRQKGRPVDPSHTFSGLRT